MLTAQLAAPPLGSFVEDALGVVTQVKPYLDIVQMVLEDPALPRVASQVRTISRFPSASSTPPKPGQIAPKEPGIGLKRVVGPLDAYIWSKQHRGATIALGIAALLAPIAAGVLVGRLTKRCRVGGGK